MCLVHNVKKIVKKVLEGTVSLPEKYGKLIEEAMLGYKEEQLTLVGAECKISPKANETSRKG